MLQEGKTFTSDQLHFLNEMIDYLTHNGTIDVLYRFPFNSIAPGGPEGIFIEADIEAMITTIHSVKATAVPA